MDLVTARCASCEQDVPAGRFCEACGAPLAPPTCVVALTRVAAYRGDHAATGLAIDKVRTGTGLVATSTRAGEREQRTFAGNIRVLVSSGGPDVEVAAEGLGIVTFTEQRAFGVVTEGRAGKDRLDVDVDGDGVVAVFSGDRALFNEIEPKGKRRVAILGPNAGLVVEGYASMTADGSFARADEAEIVAAARQFAAGAPAPDAPTQPAPAVEPPTQPAPAVEPLTQPAPVVEPPAAPAPAAAAPDAGPASDLDLLDTAGRLRRVAPGTDLTADIGVSLAGKHPVVPEREVVRYGAVVRLVGGRPSPDEEGVFQLGELLQGAGEVLVTADRLVVSLWTGDSVLGSMNPDSAVVVFSFPWNAFDEVSTPVKKTISDRVAGDKTVSLMNFTAAALRVMIIPRSTFAPPPRSEPSGRARADEVMRTLAATAAGHRLRTAPAAERPRLQAIVNGRFEEIDAEHTARLVADDESPGEPAAVEPAPTTEPTAAIPAWPEPAPAEPAPVPAAEPTGAIPAWPEPARSVPAVPARDATPAPPAPRRTSPVTVVAVAVAALAVAALAFVLLTGDDSTPSSEPRAALAGDAAATPEPEATVAVTAEPDAAAQDEEVDAVATEEPVEDPPAEDPPPAPTTRVVKGDGYEFTVPKGAGWSLGRRETGSSGRLFRRELTGPDGIVILIVHTPDDPARPDPSTVVRRRGLDAQATDAARLTLQDFPTDECEGRRCDDFVLNDPAFGGLAILANGTGSEPAAVAARDIARSVVAG